MQVYSSDAGKELQIGQGGAPSRGCCSMFEDSVQREDAPTCSCLKDAALALEHPSLSAPSGTCTTLASETIVGRANGTVAQCPGSRREVLSVH